MRKELLMFLFIAVPSVAIAQNEIATKRYCAFVEGGYSIGIGDYKIDRVEFMTSHGLLFGSDLFIGAGLAINNIGEYKTPKSDIPLDIRKRNVDIPIFLNIRYSFPKVRLSPFGDAKIGKYLNNDGGKYLAYTFGVSIPIYKKGSFINIGIGGTFSSISFQTFDKFIGNNNSDYTRYDRKLDTEALSIKLGCQF